MDLFHRLAYAFTHRHHWHLLDGNMRCPYLLGDADDEWETRLLETLDVRKTVGKLLHRSTEQLIGSADAGV